MLRLAEYAETFIYIRKRPGVAQLSETDRLVQDFAEPLDEPPMEVDDDDDDLVLVEEMKRDLNPKSASSGPKESQNSKLIIPTITDSHVRQSQRIRQSDFVQIQISKCMKVRQLKSKVGFRICQSVFKCSLVIV